VDTVATDAILKDDEGYVVPIGGIAYAGDLLDVFRGHSSTPIDDLIAFWIYGE